MTCIDGRTILHVMLFFRRFENKDYHTYFAFAWCFTMHKPDWMQSSDAM